MFRRFSIYVDIVTASMYYTPILNALETYIPICEPITNVSDTLEKPNFIYNLLIIDFAKIRCDSNDLQTIKESYTSAIVINVPNIKEAYDQLTKLNVSKTIREGFFESELISAIHEQIRLELITNENALLDNLFSSAQNSIVITDKKGFIQFANPYFETVSEYGLGELLENSPNILKSGQHADAFYKSLWETITQGDVWEGIFVNKSKTSKLFYEEATITPITNTHGSIERFLKIGKNITREKMLLDELSKEIKVAKKVLNAFLPKWYSDNTLSFDYSMMDFNEIGGDFIYFKQLPQNPDRYYFALIDVMGHGISSALIALTVVQMFDDHTSHLSLEETVIEINQMLCHFNQDDNEGSKYVTGIFIEIDSSTQTLTYINAGHPDAIIEFSDHSQTTLTANNMILGVIEHKTYNQLSFDYKKINKIITFSDGFYENHDYTLDQVLELLRKSIHSIGKSADVAKLLQIKGEIKDDATVCVLRF